MHEPARVMTSDSEIDMAIKSARKYEIYDRLAIKAEYLASTDRLRLVMNDGAAVSIPRRLIQGLADVRKREKLSRIQILERGAGLLWPLLDVSHSVQGLIAGVYGSERWMNELGSKNARPVAARRRNGLAKSPFVGRNRLGSKAGSREQRRDRNGRIQEKSGNTSVETLRKIYGQDFLSDWRNDAKLSAVRQETDMSLIEMVRQHRLGKKLPSPAHQS